MPGELQYSSFKSPCYQCQDRHPLCHAECERYKTAKAEHEKRCEKVNGRNNKETVIVDYIQARKQRGKRKR